MFLILGHFEKTRMFFQSAFASNKSVSLSLSSGVQKTIPAKFDFHVVLYYLVEKNFFTDIIRMCYE